MREVILNYWNWFADLVSPYHDVINMISTIVIAAFTVVLARVARKQTRDARILQRAYLNVKFGGIQNNSSGQLVGHVTFQNVGHLPARKLHWLVKLNRGGSDSATKDQKRRISARKRYSYRRGVATRERWYRPPSGRERRIPR
jgi:hypothetical protein